MIAPSYPLVANTSETPGRRARYFVQPESASAGCPSVVGVKFSKRRYGSRSVMLSMSRFIKVSCIQRRLWRPSHGLNAIVKCGLRDRHDSHLHTANLASWNALARRRGQCDLFRIRVAATFMGVGFSAQRMGLRAKLRLKPRNDALRRRDNFDTVRACGRHDCQRNSAADQTRKGRRRRRPSQNASSDVAAASA